MNEIDRESEFNESCLALLESACPEIYQRNAFRVLGLSVEATPSEISQHAQRLQLVQKYKAMSALKTPLPLNPPPDEYQIGEALYKLQDAEKRLIDEFFWFWPHQLGQGKTDQALALLSQGDINGAAELWRQMEQSSDAYVSMHNLAVLFHCLALDLEQKSLSQKLDQKELKTLSKYWDYAFKRWKVVLNHEPFWSRLKARIQAIEDPRLTTGLARRMRASLPLALLSINATLAVRYAEAGNLEAAERQVKIMGLWDSLLMQKALRGACEPIRQRIKSICKNAEEEVDKEPIYGDKVVTELIAHTKPLLAILDTLLSRGDAMRDAVHDEVALCVLRCQIAYGNETENWKVSLKLLEMALPIAVGQPVRDRIQQNIDIVKTNLEYSICWFCKENSTDDKSALEIKMYGDVIKIPTWNEVRVIWRSGKVKVPRCAQCKSVHEREDRFRKVGGVLGGILGLGSCIAVAADFIAEEMWFLKSLVVFILNFFIGKSIGGAIGIALRPKGVKPESAKMEFPSVKQLLSQGWKLGEEPPTDQ